MARHSFTYFVLDVFTDEPYKGNPLSVVQIAQDVDLQVYRQIAREFGYAETSFVNYDTAEKVYKVRSFTPGGFEVGGAGHNLLGAVCLAVLKGWDIFNGQGEEKYVNMMGQRIPLSVRQNEAGLPLVQLLQRPAIKDSTVPADLVAAAIGLPPADLALRGWLPEVTRTEVTHLMVPIADREALNKATVNKPLLHKAAEQFGFEGVYLFTLPDEAGNPGQAPSGQASSMQTPSGPRTGPVAECRFFNPGLGIDEDPATGSAAGPLAGYLHAHQYIQSDRDYTFLQGVQMQHPSNINVRVTREGIWVSGSSFIVMEGTLYV